MFLGSYYFPPIQTSRRPPRSIWNLLTEMFFLCSASNISCNNFHLSMVHGITRIRISRQWSLTFGSRENHDFSLSWELYFHTNKCLHIWIRAVHISPFSSAPGFGAFHITKVLLKTQASRSVTWPIWLVYCGRRKKSSLVPYVLLLGV